jgi:hypothetical protein
MFDGRRNRLLPPILQPSDLVNLLSILGNHGPLENSASRALAITNRKKRAYYARRNQLGTECVHVATINSSVLRRRLIRFQERFGDRIVTLVLPAL